MRANNLSKPRSLRGSEIDCYLCGEPIRPDHIVTGDHVVPTALLGKKQPKVRGYDYAGRIRTHRACNNHFSDEVFFKQSLHLVQLIQSGRAHGALQNVANPEISILPVTPDQVSAFAGRDFKRFDFIDTREFSIEDLKDPNFYAGKRKTNLLKVATHAAMTVMAKSAAALLVKRKLDCVPRSWRIFASPFHVSDFDDVGSMFGATVPFDRHTRASFQNISKDEWLVAYQHKSLLVLFLFVFHETDVELRNAFNIPGDEVHQYSGRSLNDLLTNQWHVI